MAGAKKYQYTITFNGQSETLTVNPAGWDKIGISLIRNKTYHSIPRSITLSLRFANKSGGGYSFIKNAYDSQGIYANITVEIKKRNPSTNGFDSFYSGKLDLTPERFTITRNYIEVSIIDGDKVQKLFSRDEINYNLFTLISTDGVSIADFSNNYSVNLTPIDIYLEGEYYCEASNNLIVNNETKLTYFSLVSAIKNQLSDRVVIDSSSATIYTNSTSKQVTINITINGQVDWSGTADDRFRNPLVRSELKMYNSLGALQNELYLDVFYREADISSFDYTNTFTKSTSYTIEPNGYIDLETRFRQQYIDDNPMNQFDRYKISIQEISSGYQTTSTNCFFPHEAFTRLIQLMTSETDTDKLFYSEIMGRTDSEFQSYVNNGDICYDAIFSGLNCRNYPNSPINVNLRDLFKSFDAIYNLGFGYDNENDRFYIEPKSYFYNSDYFMFHLGEVNDLQITPMADAYFSKINSGYDNQVDYEELQGAYEFNVKTEYSLATPVKEEKDIQSKYRADSVGIEITRKKQYAENVSLDTDSDNAIFIVRTDGQTPILDATVTGFPGCEKYYNTMITPRQNMVRWGSIIKPSLYKTNSGVNFQTTDKLFNLVVNGNNETSSISQSELGDSLIIPELYIFDAYLTNNQLQILLNNPHGFISFTYLGVQYEGFVDELQMEDNNGKTNFKLIAKPLSEFNNFMFFDGNNFVFYDSDDLIFYN